MSQRTLVLLKPDAVRRGLTGEIISRIERKAGWQITAGGPPGTNHLVAMVSREPRDFADEAWVATLAKAGGLSGKLALYADDSAEQHRQRKPPEQVDRQGAKKVHHARLGCGRTANVSMRLPPARITGCSAP